MSKLSVIRPALNGNKKPPAKAGQKVSPKPPSLADLSDDLYTLRDLLKRSHEAERKLTAEVLEGMRRLGADRIEGTVSVAYAATRTNWTVDPQCFLESVGQKGFAAMSVSVTGARAFLGEEDIRGISEVTTATTLRVVQRELATLKVAPKDVK